MKLKLINKYLLFDTIINIKEKINIKMNSGKFYDLVRDLKGNLLENTRLSIAEHFNFSVSECEKSKKDASYLFLLLKERGLFTASNTEKLLVFLSKSENNPLSDFESVKNQRKKIIITEDDNSPLIYSSNKLELHSIVNSNNRLYEKGISEEDAINNFMEKVFPQDTFTWNDFIKFGFKVIKPKFENYTNFRIKFEKNFDDCIICFIEKKNMLLEPCNHICSCEKCSKDLKNCPICRTLITSSKKVYIT